MKFYQEPNDSNVGAKPELDFVYLTTHAAVTKGSVYAMDITTATVANLGQVTTSKAGPDGALEANVWVVAMESKGSGETAKFAVKGYVEILAGSGGLTAADAASADGSAGVITAPADDVVIALVPADISAAATGYVWFDGTGFYIKGA